MIFSNMIFSNLKSKQQFLNSYWQKQPLLFRNVMKNSEKLISKQQLFNLSLCEDIESRLLMEKGPDEDWQVFYGPQDAEQIESLSSSKHWTLLVQSVNLWHKACAKLLKDFDFIPEWRLDDIMISYASESGTVGPHIDHYDVFLIQLSGTRRWKVGKPDAEVEMLHPDTASQHIKPYPEIINEILEPGDMLYVPPNTAHHGISIKPGMTLSVGFRSPALSEMMMIFAEQIMLDKKEDYYYDALFKVDASATEISSAAMSKAVNWFSNLEQLDALKRKSFGLLQTQPKQELILSAVDLPILEILDTNQVIKRDPAARVAWYQASEELIWLFINGECYERPVDEKKWIKDLSVMKKLTSKKLSRYLGDNKFVNLLQIFVDSGLFGIK